MAKRQACKNDDQNETGRKICFSTFSNIDSAESLFTRKIAFCEFPSLAVSAYNKKSLLQEIERGKENIVRKGLLQSSGEKNRPANFLQGKK
jgi:hypothetical protein